MSPKNIRAARTSEALLRTERHALLEHLGNTRKPGRMRWERWRRAGQLAGLPRFGALSFRPTARLTSVGRMPGQGQPLEVDLKLNGLLFRFGAVAKKVDANPERVIAKIGDIDWCVPRPTDANGQPMQGPCRFRLRLSRGVAIRAPLLSVAEDRLLFLVWGLERRLRAQARLCCTLERAGQPPWKARIAVDQLRPLFPGSQARVVGAQVLERVTRGRSHTRETVNGRSDGMVA